MYAALIITYNRASTLAETLACLRRNLTPQPDIWIVADDGSTDDTHEVVRQFGAELVMTQRGGMGKNTNAGLRAAWQHTPLVLQVQDDRQLQKPLDLSDILLRLDEPTSSWIRLDTLFKGRSITATMDRGYWRMHWSDKYLYIASDAPHIKHRRFHDVAGMYPEDKKIGHTENAWCARCRSFGLDGILAAPLIPAFGLPDHLWKNAGPIAGSWQGKGL
jgi:glycosyltransferase involved in cell wall biosynthesis